METGCLGEGWVCRQPGRWREPPPPTPDLKGLTMEVSGVPERGSDAAPRLRARPGTHVGMGDEHGGWQNSPACGGMEELWVTGDWAVGSGMPGRIWKSPKFLRTRSVLFQGANGVLCSELCPPLSSHEALTPM